MLENTGKVFLLGLFAWALFKIVCLGPLQIPVYLQYRWFFHKVLVEFLYLFLLSFTRAVVLQNDFLCKCT